jgi:spermidine/putrescine transport system ATP-binding protein
MIPGEVLERGDMVTIRAFDAVVKVPADRISTDSRNVIVGVRPEKLHIRRAGQAVPEGHNSVSGIITDASFVGVSTQYLVATPWGQELIAFEQNMSVADAPRRGDPVLLSWEPGHTFGLDGDESMSAGIDDDVLAVGPYNAADAESGVAPIPISAAGTEAIETVG